MSDEIKITSTSRKEVYEELLPQMNALLAYEPNLVARLSLICGGIKQGLGFFWVGFYLIEVPANCLVIGPFQGPVPCTRINYNQGVCGKAWAREQTIIVADVDQYPGHIACSSLSRSEIVVPLINNHTILGVLDIDSTSLNDFSAIDKHYLEELIRL